MSFAEIKDFFLDNYKKMCWKYIKTNGTNDKQPQAETSQYQAGPIKE